MRVKVGNNWFQAEPGQPIMVELNEKDKKNIAEMGDSTRYALFDNLTEMTKSEKVEWVTEVRPEMQELEELKMRQAKLAEREYGIVEPNIEPNPIQQPEPNYPNYPDTWPQQDETVDEQVAIEPEQPTQPITAELNEGVDTTEDLQTTKFGDATDVPREEIEGDTVSGDVDENITTTEGDNDEDSSQH